MNSLEVLRRAKDFITKQSGVIAPLPISEEEINPNAQRDKSYDAIPLESTECRQVNYNYPEESNRSEFSFFEDGRQRTVQIGYIPTPDYRALVPVHFFVVAAVILKREDRELKVWSEPEIQSGFFIEKSLAPNQSSLAEFENMGIVIGTDVEGGDFYKLRQFALRQAKSQRLMVENRLIERWRQSEEANNNFLIVDGTLMNFRNEENVERCVGVSKSFRNLYCDTSKYNRIMQMGEFERSWTFRFHDPEDETDDLRLGRRERISWYLRLRSRPNTDPEFGLIRVEISQRHAKRASEYAERFSRSLLSERLPTAYPAPRWDKHLYPITACENYLSSIMPSISTINACMKG